MIKAQTWQWRDPKTIPPRTRAGMDAFVYSISALPYVCPRPTNVSLWRNRVSKKLCSQDWLYGHIGRLTLWRFDLMLWGVMIEELHALGATVEEAGRLAVEWVEKTNEDGFPPRAILYVAPDYSRLEVGPGRDDLSFKMVDSGAIVRRATNACADLDAGLKWAVDGAYLSHRLTATNLDAGV